METIGLLLEEWDRNLQRNINSLDDIAFIMDTLRVIREKEIDTDRELMQCEVSALLRVEVTSIILILSTTNIAHTYCSILLMNFINYIRHTLVKHLC